MRPRMLPLIDSDCAQVAGTQVRKDKASEVTKLEVQKQKKRDPRFSSRILITPDFFPGPDFVVCLKYED